MTKPKSGCCPACFNFIGNFPNPNRAIAAVSEHIKTCLPAQRVMRQMKEKPTP